TDDPPYNPWGACSYPVNAQVFCNVKLNDPKDPDGTFVNSEGNPRIGTITDGLSNTIFIGEKYARCTNSVFNGGSYWAYWNALAAPTPHFGPKHPGFAVSYFDKGVNSIGPQSKFLLQPNPYLGNCDPNRASTGHTGGMQVGLGDGSVRSLAASISGTTWWAALTPNKGDLLSGDW